MSRRRRGGPWAVALLVLLVLGGLCLRQATGRGSEPAAAGRPPTVTVDAGSAAAVRDLLGQVTVVDRQPSVPGYDRDCGPGDGCSFGTSWTDDTDAPDAHNGCDTRNDVLGEQLTHPTIAPGTRGCKVVGGWLDDPYTGQVLTCVPTCSHIQVDHVVPLGAAWDLGAAAWTQAERDRFANDTALELLAVDGGANESKGDSTPASWLPPNRGFRCAYVERYLRVVKAYDLAVTRTDVRVIGDVVRTDC